MMRRLKLRLEGFFVNGNGAKTGSNYQLQKRSTEDSRGEPADITLLNDGVQEDNKPLINKFSGFDPALRVTPSHQEEEAGG
jgi:hypothetical protein